MLMYYAIEVMSRNKDGVFQWTPQLVSILNVLGHRNLTPETPVDELLEVVRSLDPETRSAILNVKVTFDPDHLVEEMRASMETKKESNRIFYGIACISILAAILMTSGMFGPGNDPESIKHTLDFILEVLRMLVPNT